MPRKIQQIGKAKPRRQGVTALHEGVPPYRVNGNGSQRARTALPPVARLAGKKKLIPFGWYGGKFSHPDWLFPLLPPCHHYCEPFAGSGAALLNREPSPVETFNDLDGEVVNFFRVLREEKDRLVQAVGLKPFSREEFAVACEVSPDLPPVSSEMLPSLPKKMVV
ncbi:MAG: DNA adenine methylase [Verrucomicrobiota bacterium]|nr:DNA adenine methylase [Verrucomicrobiota bacterium]